MKFKLFFSLSLLISTPLMKGSFVLLESNIISKLDGLSIGIDDEIIALIKQYQGQIMAMLAGKATVDGRVGLYDFQNTKHTMQQLSTIEQTRGTSSELATLRNHMRSEFEKISLPFRKSVQGTKAMIGLLIEESCSKRNRLNSLLYSWAKTDEKNEYELFDLHVKSIKDFEIFLTDLYNFLGDLVHSCPKAEAQFAERVAKFKNVKELYIELGLPSAKQQAFMKYVNTLLSKIKTDEINREKVAELYKEFTPIASPKPKL